MQRFPLRVLRCPRPWEEILSTSVAWSPQKEKLWGVTSNQLAFLLATSHTNHTNHALRALPFPWRVLSPRSPCPQLRFRRWELTLVETTRHSHGLFYVNSMCSRSTALRINFPHIASVFQNGKKFGESLAVPRQLSLCLPDDRQTGSFIAT